MHIDGAHQERLFIHGWCVWAGGGNVRVWIHADLSLSASASACLCCCGCPFQYLLPVRTRRVVFSA